MLTLTLAWKHTVKFVFVRHDSRLRRVFLFFSPTWRMTAISNSDVDIHFLQVSEALRQEKVNEENDKARKMRTEWVRRKQLEDPQLAM